MNLEINERDYSPAILVRIDNFAGYNFVNTGGHVDFSVCEYVEQYAPNGIDFTYIKPVLFSGTIEIPFGIVSQWGQDDSIIFNYVINQLQPVLAEL
jgi:hypothetical protein